MRVLLVTPFYPPDRGGVPLHVSSLAREVGARGHWVSVLRRTDDSRGPEYAIERRDEGGVLVAAIRYRWRDCDRFEKTYRNPAIDEAFEQFVARERPEVVHFHHLTGLGIGLLGVARRAGARVALTLHDFWLGCPRSQRLTRTLERCPTLDRAKCLPCLRSLFGGLLPDGEAGREFLSRYDDDVREALASADLLVAPSRFVAERYRREYGVGPDRLRVVPVGLDPAPFRGVPRRPSDVFRVAYLGTVMPSKGVHVILEALEHLPRDRVRIDVHGEAVPWFEETRYLDALRSRVRPEDPVRFTGAYDPQQVPSLLADADAVVVPSLWDEAFSITVREAWLAGVPIVASNLGGMAEAIEDGVTGLLFPPGDALALAGRLRTLLEDPPFAERLARAPKSIPSAAETAEALLRLYAVSL